MGGAKMKLKGILAAAAVALVASVPVSAGPPAQGTSNVWTFSGLSAVGTSTLSRLPGSVQMTLRANGLPAAEVVTVWWVIFNNPAACENGEDPNPGTGFPGTKCGFLDLFEEDVNAAVVYAAGRLVGQSGVGNYAAYLSAGPVRNQVILGDEASPLDNPLGADIHLVIHPHDTADFPTIGQELHHFGCESCPDYGFAAHEVQG